MHRHAYICHIVKINHHSHQPWAHAIFNLQAFFDFAANLFEFRKFCRNGKHLGTKYKKNDGWIDRQLEMSTLVQTTNCSQQKKMFRNLLASKGTRIGQLHLKTSNLKQMSSPCVKKVTFKVALSVNCPSSSPFTISTTTYVNIAAYMVHHLDQPRAWCTPCLSFLANLPAGRAVWPSNRRDPKFLQRSSVFGICVLI